MSRGRSLTQSVRLRRSRFVKEAACYQQVAYTVGVGTTSALSRAEEGSDTNVRSRGQHGFALIDTIFCCGLIGLLAAIATPRMLLAKQSAGSASAIGSLRAINSGQLTYAFTCGFGFYAPSLTTLGTMPEGSKEAFLSAGMTSADSIIHSGYLFKLSAEPVDSAPSSCNGLDPGLGGNGFKAGADPIEPTNSRFFATNSSVEIFEDTESLYDDMPESGEPEAGHVIR